MVEVDLFFSLLFFASLDTFTQYHPGTSCPLQLNKRPVLFQGQLKSKKKDGSIHDIDIQEEPIQASECNNIDFLHWFGTTVSVEDESAVLLMVKILR